MSQAPANWNEGLPGGRTRRWHRLCRRLLDFGDPRAQAALAAYDAGTLEDFADLRLIAHLLAGFGDMAQYEALITGYDPALVLSDAPRKDFVSQGGGMGALNVFRRLDTGSTARFEKIYHQERPGLARALFALESVLPHCPAVQTPALRDRRDGDRLTVLEFDFVDFTPVAPGQPELAAPIVRQLAQIGAKRFRPVEKRLFPPYPFEQSRQKIRARLQGHDPALADRYARDHALWLQQLRRHPRVFSHGDLNFTNLSTDGTVLDWDNAGFRPYGFDAAYSCRRRRFEDADELLAFCRDHFERPGTEARDRFALAFHFLCMMPDTGVQWNNTPLLLDLLERMPALATASG